MVEAPISYVVAMPEGGWRIAGTRVSLDSLVYAYLEGRLPEVIAADFPTLTLEQIHGALAFYLRHREQVDRYLAEQDERWESLRRKSGAQHSALLQRLCARALPAAPDEDDR